MLMSVVEMPVIVTSWKTSSAVLHHAVVYTMNALVLLRRGLLNLVENSMIDTMPRLTPIAHPVMTSMQQTPSDNRGVGLALHRAMSKDLTVIRGNKVHHLSIRIDPQTTMHHFGVHPHHQEVIPLVDHHGVFLLGPRLLRPCLLEASQFNCQPARALIQTCKVVNLRLHREELRRQPNLKAGTSCLTMVHIWVTIKYNKVAPQRQSGKLRTRGRRRNEQEEDEHNGQTKYPALHTLVN